MLLKDHCIDGIPFRSTPNMSGYIKPEILVLHYTATSNYESTIAALCSERLRASAHLVVDFDGSITQLVPFNRKAWHAGKSEHHGRTNVSAFSIGIEIVNLGYLRLKDGKYYDHAKRVYDGPVFDGKHKNGGPWEHWAAYHDDQMIALAQVSRLLVSEYGLREIVGHDDIAPGRKWDVGPAFGWDEFRRAVFTDMEPAA